MPTIINPSQNLEHSRGEGWRVTTLADGQDVGAPATSAPLSFGMVARRWSLQPGARGPAHTHGPVEQLLYVIRGSGAAVVGDERLPLDPESVLWLEPGERYHFEAGPQGLEILQGYAPEEQP